MRRKGFLSIIIIFWLSACTNHSGTNEGIPKIVGFTSSQTTIVAGEEVMLSWKVVDSEFTDIVIEGLDSGLDNIKGDSTSVLPTVTTTYTLVATNSAGKVSKDLTITVTPVESVNNSASGPQAPQKVLPIIKNFTANPQRISKGESTTLNWEVVGTEPVNISITSLGNLSGNNISVSPIKNVTYTLIAANSVGKVTKDLTITVIQQPTISKFTASATNIVKGESSELSWNVTGTAPINISITSLGNRTGNNVEVMPAKTTTYTLIATNSAGTVTKDVTITVKMPVEAPKITSFTASAINILKGESSILSWGVTGTAPINISITSLGNRTGNSLTVSPLTTTTYTLIATNSAGTVSKDLTVTVTVSNKVTRFAAFGDTPYSNSEFSKVTNIFSQVATNQMPFIVHVGDIFAGGTNCNQTLYTSRKQLFNQSSIPFLVAIGDNEYNDCPNADRALSLFRGIILGSPSTTEVTRGADPSKAVTVVRQAQLLENAAWEYDNIEFVILTLPNLPGNYPLPKATIEHILSSNISFLKQRFTQATRQNRSAVVLVMQSDPTSCPISVCGSFNSELVSLVRAYGKPVISINGDNHGKSFQSGGYQNINHWAHLRPGGHASGWAEVGFSSSGGRFFVNWH